MHVFGLDFTSRPSRSKPITCASCHLAGDRLVVDELLQLESLDAFSQFLETPGPWIAGIDFPFGQPRRLVQNLNWEEAWAGYVARVADLSRQEFRKVLENYKRARPKGDREHRRRTDGRTGAQSPSKLYGVPVALMFYEGAPRLLKSTVSVIPVRPTGDDRLVVEAYPALVARSLVGRGRYKPSESGEVQVAARCLREAIVEKLAGDSPLPRYGVRVELGDPLRGQCVGDRKGDSLDAVLAAVQAAWAWRHRHVGFGVPADCDLGEGWIVDPATQPDSTARRAWPARERRHHW